MNAKKVWIVHGNWTGTGKYHVNTPKKVYNIKSYSEAQKLASNLAKKEGASSYDMENANGRWIKKKVVQVKRIHRVKRRRATVGLRIPRFNGF